MVGDRFSSSTSCSGWLHETAPARPDPSLSCLFLKVATHPFRGRTNRSGYHHYIGPGAGCFAHVVGGKLARLGQHMYAAIAARYRTSKWLLCRMTTPAFASPKARTRRRRPADETL